VSGSSEGLPLLRQYDALLVDLDGVVHLGAEVIPAAGPALDEARDQGVAIVFVTNNASQTAVEVAGRLSALGVRTTQDEVLTSSMVAADTLAARLAPGSPVLIVGGAGLAGPIADAGLTPVTAAAESPAAVVQGWSPDLTWALLAEACVALRSGVPWVATNLDRTLPSPRGPLPGNGSMVAALSTATGRTPESVGKPQPALLMTAVKRVGASRPLMVGDRLDTDIAGAVAAAMPSLLVFTGVSGPADVLRAEPSERPDYLGLDISAVHLRHPDVVIDDSSATCRGITVSADGEVTGSSAPDSDGLDGLRAAAHLAWSGRLPERKYDDVLAALKLAN
jgi:glycerol 3-phosphatase-2